MEHEAALDADALDVTPRGNKAHHQPNRAPSMSSVDTISLPPSPYKAAPTRAASGHALEDPPARRRPPVRRSKPVRMFQNMCRSLPVLTLAAPSAAARCGGRLLQAPSAASMASSPPSSSSSHVLNAPSASSFSRRRRAMTGTLFGFRDGRVALALQDNPRCRPALVVELALPTHALLRELGTTAGARIVLETEKQPDLQGDGREGLPSSLPLLQEPLWVMYCNGRRVGYAVRREPTEDDVAVLETLWAVSMGGGVLPGRSPPQVSTAAGVDGAADVGEMAYMRGCFEHVIGSRDSESLYMVGPHGGDCPELAVFFVRL